MKAIYRNAIKRLGEIKVFSIVSALFFISALSASLLITLLSSEIFGTLFSRGTMQFVMIETFCVGGFCLGSGVFLKGLTETIWERMSMYPRYR